MWRLRKIIWRLLGMDYQIMLLKNDFTLLKNDGYTQKGIGTYDNGAKVWRWTNTPLIIGKFCSIAHDVNFIVDEGHHTISKVANFPIANNLFRKDENIGSISKPVFFKKFKQKEGIRIGNDVWIGMGAFILPGVTIGNGAIIAANAVVTDDVQAYEVVGGSPAKLIRMKYEKEIVDKLNTIAWWDWDEEIIKLRIEDFYGSIEDFVQKYW